MQDKSFAMEMLEYSKEQNVQLHKNNKRLFIIWVITFIGLLLAVGYIIHLSNKYQKVEDYDTIDIEDVEEIDNSHIKIGDDIWEKSN